MNTIKTQHIPMLPCNVQRLTSRDLSRAFNSHWQGKQVWALCEEIIRHDFFGFPHLRSLFNDIGIHEGWCCGDSYFLAALTLKHHSLTAITQELQESKQPWILQVAHIIYCIAKLKHSHDPISSRQQEIARSIQLRAKAILLHPYIGILLKEEYYCSLSTSKMETAMRIFRAALKKKKVVAIEVGLHDDDPVGHSIVVIKKPALALYEPGCRQLYTFRGSQQNQITALTKLIQRICAMDQIITITFQPLIMR